MVAFVGGKQARMLMLSRGKGATMVDAVRGEGARMIALERGKGATMVDHCWRKRSDCSCG